ncbi:hypothetical protein TNCV_334051 [Trichonephila clavipes]|nr:hypothetical protein TNCV_334051 [Trichonephila clavipes]
MSSTVSLTFYELSSLKIKPHHLGRTPSSHSWYFERNPEGSFKLMPREYQTAFSRFVSGHIKTLTFRQDLKMFPDCHLCYSELTYSAHILSFLDFKNDEVLQDPLLFLEFHNFFWIYRDCPALLENLGLETSLKTAT